MFCSSVTKELHFPLTLGKCCHTIYEHSKFIRSAIFVPSPRKLNL